MIIKLICVCVCTAGLHVHDNSRASCVRDSGHHLGMSHHAHLLCCHGNTGNLFPNLIVNCLYIHILCKVPSVFKNGFALLIYVFIPSFINTNITEYSTICKNHHLLICSIALMIAQTSVVNMEARLGNDINNTKFDEKTVAQATAFPSHETSV